MLTGWMAEPRAEGGWIDPRQHQLPAQKCEFLLVGSLLLLEAAVFDNRRYVHVCPVVVAQALRQGLAGVWASAGLMRGPTLASALTAWGL